MPHRYCIAPKTAAKNQAEKKKLGWMHRTPFTSLVLNILMTTQDLALELFRVLVPQLGGFTV